MKVDIKLGYSCNNECIHCVVADNRDLCRLKGRSENLSTDEYKDELADSRKRGYNVVVFTGGEPTMRNDLAHLMYYAAGIGYKVDMQTNGRRFCSYEFSRSLTGITAASYCIAIHGSDDKIHDRVTAVNGSYRETVRGIVNLTSLGQEVVGKIVLSKVNFSNLPEICALCEKIDLKDLTITFPHALGNARKHFSSVVPSYTETLPYLKKAIDFCKERNMTARTEAYPLCLMEGYENAVTELFFPDTKTELKQLGHENYIMDWSKARLDNKAKFSSCGTCRYDLICEGPWNEYPEKFGSTEFVPVKGKTVQNRDELINKTSGGV